MEWDVSDESSCLALQSDETFLILGLLCVVMPLLTKLDSCFICLILMNQQEPSRRELSVPLAMKGSFLLGLVSSLKRHMFVHSSFSPSRLCPSCRSWFRWLHSLFWQHKKLQPHAGFCMKILYSVEIDVQWYHSIQTSLRFAETVVHAGFCLLSGLQSTFYYI